MNYKFKHAILGGTFDHFHKGHKHFLDTAFSQAENITIGLTTSELIKNKLLFGTIESYETREKVLKDFLEKYGYTKRASIIPINDIYGNSLEDKNIDSIFITDMGLKNAQKINEERKKKGFPLINIIKVETLDSKDGEIISSTRIRSGEIDRNGHSYLSVFSGTQELLLPDFLRAGLKKPAGKIVSEIDKNYHLEKDRFIIAVGDIVVANLIKRGYQPNISIFDFKTKRQEITDNNIVSVLPRPQTTLDNAQGTINTSSVYALHSLIKRAIETNEKIAIKIIGEEDLLTLPAILLTPLGSVVFYGIRDVGAVEITVTEEKKQEIEREYLDRFERN